jgi:AbiU2
MSDLELRRLTKRIHDDLQDAIAFYEVFVPAARDATLIDEVNAARVHPGFNAVCLALHGSAILALCRLWDTDRRAAHIPKAATMMRQRSVLEAIAASSGECPDPGQLAAWQQDVEAVQASEELKALRRARDRFIAHTANPNSKEHPRQARQSEYGDERRLLEMTIPIVERLDHFLFDLLSWSGIRGLWQEEARRFWERVAAGKG